MCRGPERSRSRRIRAGRAGRSTGPGMGDRRRAVSRLGGDGAAGLRRASPMGKYSEMESEFLRNGLYSDAVYKDMSYRDYIVFCSDAKAGQHG